MFKVRNTFQLLTVSALTVLALGCNNVGSTSGTLRRTTTDASTAVNTGGSGTGSNTFTVAYGKVVDGSTREVQLNFKTPATSTATTFGSVCPLGAGCLCKFEWTQVAGSGTTNITLKRKDRSRITSVQPWAAACPAPVAWTEILKGTAVTVQIVSPLNMSVAYSEKYTLVKGTSDNTSADFVSNEGVAFQNIYHYSCYDVTEIDTTIVSKSLEATLQDPNSGQTSKKSVPMATQFCAKIGGKITDQANCANLQTTSRPSADSRYYDLFIQSSRKGSFSLSNKKFFCPLVKEAIGSNGSISTESRPYPMDSTFALAQSPTEEFTVGVQAPAVLGISDDPTTATTDCTGGKKGNAGDPNSISPQCIGFAKRPESDGSCAAIKDKNGQPMPTSRLRRYIAFFPASYDVSGRPIDQPISANVVYVADRPLANSPNPEKPYTMYGPKPCNYAIRDISGTLGLASAVSYAAFTDRGDGAASTEGRPSWVATNDSQWDGKNFNGTAFPWFDSGAQNSCSALLPLIKYSDAGDPLYATYATTHASNLDGAGNANTYDIGGGRTVALNKVYVRPQYSWAPHYVEDKSFQACVPQSSNFVSPPIHLTRQANGNVAYCAENYPTQYDGIEKVDRKFGAKATAAPVGYVYPFTSHVVKRTVANLSCTATVPTIPTGYPAASGAACAVAAAQYEGGANAVAPGRHTNAPLVDYNSKTALPVCADKTCDRTIVNNMVGGLPEPPLLAKPKDVERMLYNDPGYACLVSYDGGSGKTDKRSPSDGCCHANKVDLATGGNGQLGSTTWGANAPFNENNGAHAEPGTCDIPRY